MNTLASPDAEQGGRPRPRTTFDNPSESTNLSWRTSRTLRDIARTVCWVSGNLGESLRAMGRLQEAERCLRRAIETATRPDDRKTGADVWGWGILYERLGLRVSRIWSRPRRGRCLSRRPLARYEREDAAKPDVIWQKLHYARFLTHCPATQFRNPERAVALAKRAVQWAPQSRGGWQAARGGRVPIRALGGRDRGAGQRDQARHERRSFSSGSSWPWRTGKSAARRRAARCTIRPPDGSRRAAGETRPCPGCVLRRLPCWVGPSRQHPRRWRRRTPQNVERRQTS